jgi:steroid 5-alpha reductase family enzyme
MALRLLLGLFFVGWAFASLFTLLRQDMYSYVLTNFLICGTAAIAFMTIMFLIARRIKRYDLVDAAWGSGFMVVALTSFFLGGAGDGTVIDLVVTLLVIIWGSRLSVHILKRINTTKTEDPRYLELRKNWRGNVARNIYVRIYLLQAALVLLISVPVIHVNLFNPGTKQWVDIFSLFGINSIGTVMDMMSIVMLLGVILWVVGFVFEVISDHQLRKFVSSIENKGRLMTSGLWRYSRHPNYFGELIQWWAIFIICLTTAYGWVGIISPVLITYLILYVSGIPPNEKRNQRKLEWKEYKLKTNILWPLPPKS